MRKKVLLLFLTFTLIISLSFNYQYYKLIKNKNDKFQIFLNDFYHEVDLTIHTLDTLIQEKPADNRLNDTLVGLRIHLKSLDYMIRDIPRYIDILAGGSNDMGDVSYIINSGTNYQGHYIPPFGKDGKLTENELAFLREFKIYMENIRKHLQSKETVFKVNNKISVYEYNDIISKNIIDDINYTLFLDKYIESNNK